MSQNRECSATPKLRFPDFQNAPAWAAQSIGRILTESRIPSSQSSPDRRITVRLHGQGVERREYRGTESLDATRHFTRKAGQFIYGKQNIHKGAFGIIPPELDGFETSQDLPAFDFSDDYCSRWFLYYLSREHYYTALEKKMTGTGSKRLSEEVFLTQPILVPTKREQQKIAECLSTLDELIEAESRKLDALKNHKKGLMQQLFPREGETRPRLRLPEFRDAPEWEEKPLGEVADYENGKAYEPHIVANGKYVVVNSRFISTDGAIRKFSNDTLCIAKCGDVLMVLSDLPKGRALAKCFYADADDLYAVNQRVCRLEAHSVDSKFLFFLLNRHPKLLAYDDGMNQTHLKKDVVLQCPLMVPPSRAEQQYIATCLSSLDDLITAQSERLEALRTHKRGLMQQLFPNPSGFES